MRNIKNNINYSNYKERIISPQEAVKEIRSGDRIYMGTASSMAYTLVEALRQRTDKLEGVQIQLSNSLIVPPIFTEKGVNEFSFSSPFMGSGERAAMKSGFDVQFTSVHLSEFDKWFYNTGKPNVAFLEVSEPDKDGNMSLGPTGAGVHRFVLKTAEYVVVQINPNVPFIKGEAAFINFSEVDAVVLSNDELPTVPIQEVDEESKKISEMVLDLIPDAATIQLGIGGLTTAVGYGLSAKTDLGLHSELISESIMNLINNGNITNKYKGYMDGKSVFAFAIGSKEMYASMDHNDSLYCGTFPSVNDSRNIAKNRNMISINGAMAIDLYGEVAADCMGGNQYSGVGGQLDFVQGAQWSEGGKSIIATTSTFMKKGVRQSKIVLDFTSATPVTTPRADVQYIATEYGCINLKNLTMKDRIRAMISLAHPDFRDELRDQAREKHIL